MNNKKNGDPKTAEVRKPFVQPQVKKHDNLPVITAGSITIR